MKGTSSWSKLNSGLESPRLKSENISTSKKSNGASAVSFGTVVDCLYIDEQRQGEITFSSPQMGQNNAYPLNPNLKNYPIAGEQVIVFSVPKNILKVNENGGPFHGQDGFYFYQTINIWNNPNLNAVKKSSQFTNLGVPFYFPLNKSQGIFPLTACVGDVILEGRYGNSIRLGNTSTEIPNLWSQNGITGDPITIIRNGQSPQGLTGGIENIKDDLSSLYLTSYQKLSQLSLINENFKSYKTEPLTPASYQKPQIALNSSRIILNAKEDDILISAQNSIGLSSNGTINIESTSDDGTIIDGNIKLGKKSADEPVLLGYQTTVLLKQLITEVRNISLALEVNQVFPEGVPAADGTNISVAASAVKTCNTLLERLTVKSTNGKQSIPYIMSRKVKVSR
jgi:hypothetical protein